MADDLVLNSRLRLSATELRALHPDWDSAATRDYLGIGEDIEQMRVEVNTKNAILKAVTNVTFADSPYTPLATDEEIFFDTDGGPIACNLPPGINGTNYRMINTGFSDNNVTMTPDGTDKLFGLSQSEDIFDTEVVIMTYSIVKGWY